MIKSQRLRQGIGIKNADIYGVVGGLWVTGRLTDKDNRNGMMPWVSGRIRIGSQLIEEFHLQGGFFPGLPDCGRLQGFAHIDESAG